MRYILRSQDDIAMFNSVHDAILFRVILEYNGITNLSIYDTITNKEIA